MGHDLYIYNNLLTKKSTQTTMHHVITHIQERVEKQEVTLQLYYMKEFQIAFHVT
jgi:hypothetical protein